MRISISSDPTVLAGRVFSRNSVTQAQAAKHRRYIANICNCQALPSSGEGHIELARIVADQLGTLVLRNTNALFCFTHPVNTHDKDDRAFQPCGSIQGTYTDMLSRRDRFRISYSGGAKLFAQALQHSIDTLPLCVNYENVFEWGALLVQGTDFIDDLGNLILLTAKRYDLRRCPARHVLNVRCHQCLIIPWEAHLIHPAGKIKNLTRGSVALF